MGVTYKKAGICLSSFEDDHELQPSLFNNDHEIKDDDKTLRLMKVIDEINAREGAGMIRSMACGVDNKAWAMKRDKLSPRYVTGWSSLPKAK